MFNHHMAGQRYFDYLELDEYLKCVKVQLPVHTVVGKADGPTLYLQACQHGTEINGWEAARQVLDAVSPERLGGKLVVVIVANPIAFQARLHGYPWEGKNMNRVWPGNPQGAWMPERLAALLWEKLIVPADAVIDFHCWGDVSIPMAWTPLGMRPWIEAFGTPFVYETEINRSMPMLQNPCFDAGKPYCALEMIPQDVINLSSVPLGRMGALNILRYMNMLDGEIEFAPERFVFKSPLVDHLPTVTTEGMWVPAAPKATLVNAGQVLGRVFDWETLNIREEILSPADGLYYFDRPVTNQRNQNLVEPGDNVACVREVETVLHPVDGPRAGTAPLASRGGS
ncbi:MAG: succinylglutamate desuccinylase/aspartoacylase family protein [Armatimonadota bacterium]